MGFDIGSLMANLFMAYFSQEGWGASTSTDRSAYAQWLLDCITQVWILFSRKFLALWEAEHNGALYANMKGTPGIEVAKKLYMKDLFIDTLAYTGIEIIRRIVGVAPVADLQTIPDEDHRAKCETKGLKFARVIIKNAALLNSIEEVVELAKQ